MSTAAEALIRFGLELFRPPKRMTLTEWSDENAVLSPESSADPGPWKTIPYQRGIMDAMTDPKVEMVSVIKSARVGYALALDTPIPTPQGWSTMGALVPGDVVFSELGKPCTVLYCSPVYTNHECFEIEFCDGTKVIADKGHRWFVESDVSFEHLRGERGAGRTGRPKPGQIATTSGVIDTGEMAKMLTTSRGRNALAIPNAVQLDLPEIDLPMPPYALGLWLGDGHMVSPRITQHRSDTETAAYIEAEGISVSIQYADKRYPNNATYFMGCCGGRKDPSPWASVMRKMGVLNNKHIPAIYLRASASQRLQLLRGLMDSDGNISGGKRSFAEFVNTNKLLADGVFELAVSLGMKASISTRIPQRSHHLPQYRVVFRPSPTANPFNLSRKAEMVRWPERPTITTRRRVVAVRTIESIPVRCIEVDSPSSLFLCSRSMIPTHNTKCIGNLVAYHIHQDPCPIMVVQPTVEDAEGYSKEEIAPMLRDTPCLRGLVSDGKARDSGNTILQKMFPGGTLSLVGANSPRGFRRVSRRIVIFDEVDGYPTAGAGNEGDQIKLGIRRSEYYWNRKIVAGSTPTTKNLSRIEDLFSKSDQRRYFVPCPHCGEMQYLKFGGKEKPFGIKWPEGRPEDAYYVCEHSGCVIEHKDKRWMVERGEWRATAPGNGRHAGFHIWAAYSYSPNADWGTLAVEFLEAKSDPLKLQTFVNTVLGETWEESGDTVDPSALAQRLEDYPRGSIPEGVAVLVGSCDVQGDRIEAKIIGYGAGEESWLVDYEIFWGDPGNDPHVWEQLDEWRQRDRIHHGNRQPMKLAILGIDSSNGSHMDAIYDYVRPRQSQRVFAFKGRDYLSRPGLVMESTAKKGHVRLFLIATHMAKDRVMSRMRNGRRGPGYMHLPNWVPEQYLEQMTAEKKIVKRTKQGTWQVEWISTGRNEAFDMEVYCLAGLFILQTMVSPALYGDLARLYQQVMGGQPLNVPVRARGVRSAGIPTG